MCVCVCVCVRACVRACVRVCACVCVYSLEVCVKTAIWRFIYLFWEVLRCPHKSIVTITKVYIARNNIHVEILRFHTN